MRLCIAGLVGLGLLPCITGLMCYWCSGVGNDRDCERKPLGIRAGPANVNCSSKFCTTAKVMDLENGEVKSFARFCDNVYRGNRCMKDTKLMTCYQACVYDHCNNGNPSPNYLRVENLVKPDPDAKEEVIPKKSSTGSRFHFFTAPSLTKLNPLKMSKNDISHEREDDFKEPVETFKEQSIFKSFTTTKPKATTSLPKTSSDALLTPSTMTSVETSPPPTALPETESTPEESGPQHPQDEANKTASIDTTTYSPESTTSPAASESDLPDDYITDDPAMIEEDVGAENSVDDMGSETPVDDPDYQSDSQGETLSPELVKDDLADDLKVDEDSLTTTTKQLDGKSENLIEKTNNTKSNAEGLNLAATSNTTESSGVNSITNSQPAMFYLLAIVSLFPIILLHYSIP